MIEVVAGVICHFFFPATSDYFTLSQDVIFPAGISQRSVVISIVEDSVLEAIEFFSLRVTVPATYAGVVLLDTDVATISITDDDSKLLHWSAQICPWVLFEVACN